MSLTMNDLNKAENDIEKVCIEANRDCHKCIFSKDVTKFSCKPHGSDSIPYILIGRFLLLNEILPKCENPEGKCLYCLNYLNDCPRLKVLNELKQFDVTDNLTPIYEYYKNIPNMTKTTKTYTESTNPRTDTVVKVPECCKGCRYICNKENYPCNYPCNLCCRNKADFYEE